MARLNRRGFLAGISSSALVPFMPNLTRTGVIAKTIYAGVPPINDAMRAIMADIRVWQFNAQLIKPMAEVVRG